MSQHARPQKRAASAPPSHSVKPAIPSPLAPAVRAGTQSGGQALDRKTQRDMSARFGHDFSSVRIHTDRRAGKSAETMGANAFALGSDIVFGAGKYTPGSPETERLLAHELTHVVQQARFGPAADPSGLSRRGDTAEREADALASQVMMGRSAQVEAAPTAALHRYQAPDKEWTDKKDDDQEGVALGAAHAIPGLGNVASGIESLGLLGMAGYNAVTGNKKEERADLLGAEDTGLNAIPILGNIRALGQAGHDLGTVSNDNAGFAPATNLNSRDQWQSGGADKFNGGVSQAWDSLWG